MICVIDYGLGNVQAFLNVYKRLGIGAFRARAPGELEGATRLILPGVGAFDHAMQLLNRSGMRDAMETRVRQGMPVMGVCVGMQMMAEGSDEGVAPGLGWIPGRVKAFARAAASASLPLPHMGWNDLRLCRDEALFRGLGVGPRFYFLHSFYFDCADVANVAATASYGLDFAGIVSSGNIFGVQCHPEKSHHHGSQLLRNFAEV